MSDWLSPEDIKNLRAALSLGGISALAAMCRTILSEEQRTFAGFLTSFILGTFAGMIVGFVLQDQDLPSGMVYALVSASALTAREILMTIIKVVDTVKDHSVKITTKVINRKFK